MTRKDYNTLAGVISREHNAGTAYGTDELTTVHCDAVRGVAYLIADVCAADNPRFDRDRFLIACGVPRA